MGESPLDPNELDKYMTLQIPEGFSQVGILLDNEDVAHTSEITFGINWPGNTLDFADFRGAIENFTAAIIQDCTTNISADRFVMTQGITGGGTGSTVIPFQGGKQNGGTSADPMTPNVAYVYRKYTDQLGRAQRGRFYLPGVGEQHVEGDGSVDSSFLEDQRNHAISAMAVFTDDYDLPFDMVLLHQDPDNAPSPVTNLVPEAFVGTQRRRLIRG